MTHSMTTRVTYATSLTCLSILDPTVAGDDVHDPAEEVVDVDDEGRHDDAEDDAHGA